MYKLLTNKQLVAIAGKQLCLALVDGHELRVDRKPGIDRVVYKLIPCTVRNGAADTYNRMFRTVSVPAKRVVPVTVEEATELLRTGGAREWRAAE